MAFNRITPTRFGSDDLDIAPTLTTIRTTPTAARDILKSLDIANNNAGTATVEVYLVPSGGSADASNMLIPSVQIPPNTIFQWTGTQVMNAGATIQARSDVASVTLIASGGEAL